MIGSISGALVGGISGEKLGRKKALLIDNIIMVLGNVLYANKYIFLKINQFALLVFKRNLSKIDFIIFINKKLFSEKKSLYVFHILI